MINKNILYILVALAVVIGGCLWYSRVPATVQETPVQTLNADVYPLYTGTSWGAAIATTSPGHGAVVMVQSTPFADVTNIAEKSTPFTQYYHDKLIAAGWTLDMAEEAGGPGAEISVYRKDAQFIVVSFSSVFKVRPTDAPFECPCDLQFTLMSGTQTGPTRAQEQAAHVYHDSTLGFSLTLPTMLASSASDTLYSVDSAYEYTAMGPEKSIPGVKFTIPSSLAAGTNLSSDSYVSVEHLPVEKKCDAAMFIADLSAQSQVIREGTLSYSVASSTDAGVGNRYEETVYARTDSSLCVVVRYFVHYTVIQNFPEGVVKEFDKPALIAEFDQIRRTLALSK